MVKLIAAFVQTQMFPPIRLVTSTGHRHNKYSILKALITPAEQRHVKKSKLNPMQPIGLIIIVSIPHSSQSLGEIYCIPQLSHHCFRHDIFPSNTRGRSSCLEISSQPPRGADHNITLSRQLYSSSKLGTEASQQNCTDFLPLFHQFHDFTGHHIPFIEFPAYLPPTPTCCARQVSSS